MSTDEHQANAIARELEELNRQRQDLDRQTVSDAFKLVDQLDLDDTYGLVLWQEGWHPGVIGIVASRVLEQVCRPVIMVALDGEHGKGSGRSISAFDLHAGLSECRDLLIRFGGHRAAAGVTVAASQLEAFADRFNAVAKARLTADDLIPEVRVDLEVPLHQATTDLEALLRHFEPFGVGNATPVFMARDVELAAPPRAIGQGHLKLRLAAGGQTLDAVGWGMGALASELNIGSRFDVAFRLERDEWNGEMRLQARLADVRR